MRLGRANKEEKFEGLAKESHPFPLLLIFSHSRSFILLCAYANNERRLRRSTSYCPPPQKNYYAQRKGDGLSERLTSQVKVFHRDVTVAGCLTYVKNRTVSKNLVFT